MLKTEEQKKLARELIEILRDQKPGDVAELRKLATKARQIGDEELARFAEMHADLFEAEDGGGR